MDNTGISVCQSIQHRLHKVHQSMLEINNCVHHKPLSHSRRLHKTCFSKFTPSPKTNLLVMAFTFNPKVSYIISVHVALRDHTLAGSIEGQVMEIGLTSTSLLSPEKFPVIVPNSFFSSQVIVNKSRADYRAILTKIPLQTEDLKSSYAELTLGFNLKNMRKDELYSAEQDILLQAVQIIKNHGVALGSTWNDTK